jgi:hypothetical protein
MTNLTETLEEKTARLRALRKAADRPISADAFAEMKKVTLGGSAPQVRWTRRR